MRENSVPGHTDWSQMVTDSVTVVYILSSLDRRENSVPGHRLVTNCNRFSGSCIYVERDIYTVEFRLERKLGPWSHRLVTDCHRFSDSCIYTVELRLERKLGPWSQTGHRL